MANTPIDVFLPEPSELARILKYDESFATHLVGCTVFHKKYGECIVLRIEERESTGNLIEVKEKQTNSVSSYRIDSFGRGFFTKAILKKSSYRAFIDALTTANKKFNDDEIALRKEFEEKREADRIKSEMLSEIELYKKSLNIKSQASYGASDLQATFFRDVLKRIFDNEEMNDKEISWCRVMSAYEIIAKYNEMMYNKTNRLHYAAIAASNYRKAKLPEDCIEFSNRVFKASPGIDESYSALITSCGAAYRDIDNLPKAAAFAKKAISLNGTSFYPWNLLGAVYYEQGKFEEGDACFDRAVELGSSMEDAGRGIQGAFTRSSKDIQAALATHLMSKDPVKYAWAKKYLIK